MQICIPGLKHLHWQLKQRNENPGQMDFVKSEYFMKHVPMTDFLLF